MLNRRRLALPILGALLLGGAACGGKDDAEGQVDTELPRGDLASALTVAQSEMPVEVPDSRVRVLIGDLCEAGPADVDGIVEQLAGLPVSDQAQLDAVLQALDSGTEELCPDEVDPAVRAALATDAQAAAPSPTTTAVAASASSNGTSSASGGSAPAAESAPAGSSSTPSGASNGSTGSAAVGGGNASGSGNQSSTDYTQSVGSGSATNG